MASGLAAVIAVSGVSPALAAGSPITAHAVRAQEWWLGGLHVTQAWRTSNGSGITVAVLGTGVAASHADLAGAVTTGPDFTGSAQMPGDAFWGFDGTAVASVIAGHGHGHRADEGVMGVAPEARILSVRVNLEYNDPLNSDPAVTASLTEAIADGIRYAVSHGARIIDLPLDPGTFGVTNQGELTGQGDPAAAGGSAAERAAVAWALSRGVVLVAPAGDDGQGPGLVDYPAAYPGVIAVGAVDRDGQLAPFSSRQRSVSLTAPGMDLTVAAPPDSYAPISSTSVASGMVAGVAALILSRFPHLTVAQVTQALTGGGTATAGAPGTGQGTVDAGRAVARAAAIVAAERAAVAWALS
ncbi:MAG: S8 family serine peptidase, partial [Actinobacteria bacterium]|nr:S8 family serine peptidase [Actinomycetota bacterium]